MSVRYRLDDTQLRIYVDDLRRMQDWRKPLREIGQVVGVQGTRKRFDTERDPSGKPWVRLAEATLRRRRRSTYILRDSGMRAGLMRSITSKVQGNRVTWGTNKIYGRIHQLGGEAGRRSARVNIPARPYLGISQEDEQEIGRIVVKHLRRPGE